MADHFQVWTQQVAVEVEGTAGTAETLVAADVQLRPFQSDAPFIPEHDRFEIDEVGDDLASAVDIVGGAKGRIPFSCVLQTSGAVGTAPALADFLIGCGMKEQTVETITIGAISGGDTIFAAGETYSDGGSKTGIIETTITGAGTLRYIATAGGSLANSDVITANSDSATCSGSAADYAVKYTPRSTGQQTVTIQRAEKNSEATAAQDYLYRLKGAMGNYSVRLTPGKAPDFSSEFQGVVDLMGAGSFFTGETIESNANRPKFLSGVIQLNGVDLKVGEITFDAGNQVELDPDPSQAAGYLRGVVARRTPTIAISPRRQKASEFDDLGLMAAGTTFAVSITVGTVAGKIVQLVAPAAQIRGWSAEERVGLRTAALTLHLTRATLDDEDYALYFR